MIEEKKIIEVKETCNYKYAFFEVELEYYYDEDLNKCYVDEELRNKNNQKIHETYDQLINLKKGE